jgi:hypothetical protein
MRTGVCFLISMLLAWPAQAREEIIYELQDYEMEDGELMIEKGERTVETVGLPGGWVFHVWDGKSSARMQIGEMSFGGKGMQFYQIDDSGGGQVFLNRLASGLPLEIGPGVYTIGFDYSYQGNSTPYFEYRLFNLTDVLVDDSAGRLGERVDDGRVNYSRAFDLVPTLAEWVPFECKFSIESGNGEMQLYFAVSDASPTAPLVLRKLRIVRSDLP